MKPEGFRGFILSFLFIFFYVSLLILTTCNPISGTDVLQGSDIIAPVISIDSPADGDSYSETVTVTGTVSDMADAENDGMVDSLRYALNGSDTGLSVDIDPDNSFSFSFSTIGITGTLTLKMTAVDWNGNSAEVEISLEVPKGITWFSFLAENNTGTGLAEDVEGEIEGTGIGILVSGGTDLSALIASFLITGIEVKVGTTEQVSGETPNDFTDPVVYTVKGNDGTSTTYTVSIINNARLTFEKNDLEATGAMGVLAAIDGAIITLPPCGFYKSGYYFSGWALGSGGSVEYLDEAEYIMEDSDVTLFARWSRTFHTVFFDKNDSEAVGTMDPQVIAEGVSAELNPCTFTKEGWEFEGWALTRSGSYIYGDGDTFSMETSDVTLFAKWRDLGYEVSYNLNGGVGTVPDSVYYQTGDVVTVADDTGFYKEDPDPDPIDEDLGFVYWNTASDGSGACYVPGDTDYDDTFAMGTNDITLYAIYLGDPGPSGGWIFYDDQDVGSVDIPNARFLETDSANRPLKPWSNIVDTAIGTTGTAVGTGFDNTDDIIGQPGHDGSSAAQACRDVGPEWFLPSIDEMTEVYETLFTNGLGDLPTGRYWSSSEYSEINGYILWFGAGTGSVGKDSNYQSRAIRAF